MIEEQITALRSLIAQIREDECLNGNAEHPGPVLDRLVALQERAESLLAMMEISLRLHIEDCEKIIAAFGDESEREAIAWKRLL
jgi:hypothetical protein